MKKKFFERKKSRNIDIKRKNNRNKKNKINWTALIISIIIVFGIGFAGSIFTSSETNSDWYSSIKPKITPPNWVFPIVWNILFFLIALSLYYSWISSDLKQKRKIVIIFGINFFLNIVWSILYFKMHNPAAAFVEIILLWISIAGMIIVTEKISKKAAWLLIPYLLWVGFAIVLNCLTIL